MKLTTMITLAMFRILVGWSSFAFLMDSAIGNTSANPSDGKLVGDLESNPNCKPSEPFTMDIRADKIIRQERLLTAPEKRDNLLQSKLRRDKCSSWNLRPDGDCFLGGRWFKEGDMVVKGPVCDHCICKNGKLKCCDVYNYNGPDCKTLQDYKNYYNEKCGTEERTSTTEHTVAPENVFSVKRSGKQSESFPAIDIDGSGKIAWKNDPLTVVMKRFNVTTATTDTTITTGTSSNYADPVLDLLQQESVSVEDSKNQSNDVVMNRIAITTDDDLNNNNNNNNNNNKSKGTVVFSDVATEVEIEVLDSSIDDNRNRDSKIIPKQDSVLNELDQPKVLPLSSNERPKINGSLRQILRNEEDFESNSVQEEPELNGTALETYPATTEYDIRNNDNEVYDDGNDLKNQTIATTEDIVETVRIEIDSLLSDPFRSNTENSVDDNPTDVTDVIRNNVLTTVENTFDSANYQSPLRTLSTFGQSIELTTKIDNDVVQNTSNRIDDGLISTGRDDELTTMEISTIRPPLPPPPPVPIAKKTIPYNNDGDIIIGDFSTNADTIYGTTRFVGGTINRIKSSTTVKTDNKRDGIENDDLIDGKAVYYDACDPLKKTLSCVNRPVDDYATESAGRKSNDDGNEEPTEIFEATRTGYRVNERYVRTEDIDVNFNEATTQNAKSDTNTADSNDIPDTTATSVTDHDEIYITVKSFQPPSEATTDWTATEQRSVKQLRYPDEVKDYSKREIYNNNNNNNEVFHRKLDDAAKSNGRAYNPSMPYPETYPEEYQTIQNGPSLIITKTTYTSIPDVTYTTVTTTTLPTFEQIKKAEQAYAEQEAYDGRTKTEYDAIDKLSTEDAKVAYTNTSNTNTNRTTLSDLPGSDAGRDDNGNRRVRIDAKSDWRNNDEKTKHDASNEEIEDRTLVADDQENSRKVKQNGQSTEATQGQMLAPALDEGDMKLIHNFLNKNLRLL